MDLSHTARFSSFVQKGRKSVVALIVSYQGARMCEKYKGLCIFSIFACSFDNLWKKC